MRWLLYTLFFYLLIGGCSSLEKDRFPPPADLLPPPHQLSSKADLESIDLYLQKLASDDPSLANQWWVKYKRALLWQKKNPDLACDQFSQLTAEPLFPLRRLAILRARTICLVEKAELLPQIDAINIEPWLTQPALELGIREAEVAKDINKILSYKLQYSKLALPLEHKVKLTQEALKLAEENNLPEKIEEFKSRLYQLAPRFIESPKQNEFMEVAKDFRRVREFERSRHFYKKIANDAKLAFAVRLRALEELRRTYKLERRDDLHLQSSFDVSRFAQNALRKNAKNRIIQDGYYENQIHLARTLWTMDQKSKAEKALNEMEMKLKNKRPLAMVYWLRGRMAEEAREYAKAVDLYMAAINEPKVAGAFKGKVSWSIAWSLMRLGRLEDAIQTLQENLPNTESPFEKARYQYWIGKHLSKLGKADEAKALFKAVRDDDFLGYYGLLSQRELGETLERHATNRNPAAVLTDDHRELRDYLNPEVALWLNSVGESDVARDYLDLAAKKMQKIKTVEQKSWLQIFRLYAQAGEYQSLFDRLNQIDFDVRKDILRKSSELIFPRPYFQIVSEASQKFGVSVELIYAVMRQESAFNARARSPADAFGLMQVLPELARATRDHHRIEFATDEDLYAPDKNIYVGAAYLRQLMDKYGGQFILYVASYNASEKAIQGWMKSRFSGDSLEFIEDIPYEETRGYVRLVMRNFIFYGLLNNRPEPTRFPEEALHLASGNQ